VCIPAYQAGRHIAAAIDSVLAQNFRNFELIVLDNASTDDTAVIVKSYQDPRIRLVHNDATLPLTDNWNHAVGLCRAPLVKLLCSDDLLRPDCLRVQYQIMASAPDLAMTACRRDFIDDAGNRMVTGHGLRGLLGQRDRVGVARRVVRHGGNPIGEPGSVLFRRSAFESAGGFVDSMNLVLDVHLWVRLLAHGSFFGVADSLAAFRIRGGSVSSATHRDGARQQQLCNAEVGANPIYRVRDLDRAVGALAAPLAGLRRRGLFRLAELGRSLRPASTRPEPSPSS
jgi:glycosyltransferase involved in cell wall biosynthesis